MVVAVFVGPSRPSRSRYLGSLFYYCPTSFSCLCWSWARYCSSLFV